MGKTALPVSVLGIGAAEIGFENASPATVQRLIAAAAAEGVNVIDTAECYRDSEEKLGRALAGMRREFCLFTKCGHASGSRPIPAVTRHQQSYAPLAPGIEFGRRDWEPGTLEKTIERSLRLLGTDWIDVLQLHSCPENILRSGEVIEVLQRSKASGKTRFIGYSGDADAAVYAIQSGVFDVLETSVNIADQSSIDITLPLAQKQSMGIVAKRPLANAAWRYADKPTNRYHHTYWERLRALDYAFLRDSSAAS